MQLFFKCLFFKKHLELGYYLMHPPKLIERLKCKSQSENNERKKSWGMLPN